MPRELRRPRPYVLLLQGRHPPPHTCHAGTRNPSAGTPSRPGQLCPPHRPGPLDRCKQHCRGAPRAWLPPRRQRPLGQLPSCVCPTAPAVVVAGVTTTPPCPQGLLAPPDHAPVFLRPNPACHHTVLSGVIRGQPQVQPHTSALRPARRSFRVAPHETAAARTPRPRAAPARHGSPTNLPLTALDPEGEKEPPRDTHVSDSSSSTKNTNYASREK